MAEDRQSKQVYLDLCALNRPLDDQRQMRIRLEADAVSLILTHVRSRRLALLVSSMHMIEAGANPDTANREHIQLLLSEVGTPVGSVAVETRERAQELLAIGFGAADAVHVAIAEQVGADFVTVDDRLLRQLRRVKVGVWFGTPNAYCEKEELR